MLVRMEDYICEFLTEKEYSAKLSLVDYEKVMNLFVNSVGQLSFCSYGITVHGIYFAVTCGIIMHFSFAIQLHSYQMI